jgi:trigger factor
VRQIKVELPAEEIEQEIDKRLRELARSARLPGFRPGKVPMKILRQRFGDSVRGEVFGEQVQASFPRAVTEVDLRPAGLPEIEAEIDQAAGRYGYRAKFEVLPEVELAPLAGNSVARPVAEVTDTDVDAMVERLREQRKTWRAAERAAADGDRVKVSFQGTVDGDERSVEVTFPEQYQEDSLAGKPARFEVQVKEVQEAVLPDLDADFVSAFGVADGDLERFRADVRGNMERELAQRVKSRIKNQVMDLLLDVNPIDLPDVLIAQEVQALKEQTRQSVGGGAFELPDELFTDSARRRVGLGLIVAELVKRHNLTADADKVRAAVEELAATYEDPQAVIEYYYADRQRLSSVESLVLENQVVDFVLGEVDVTEETTSFDALTQSPESAG